MLSGSNIPNEVTSRKATIRYAEYSELSDTDKLSLGFDLSTLRLIEMLTTIKSMTTFEKTVLIREYRWKTDEFEKILQDAHAYADEYPLQELGITWWKHYMKNPHQIREAVKSQHGEILDNAEAEKTQRMASVMNELFWIYAALNGYRED